MTQVKQDYPVALTVSSPFERDLSKRQQKQIWDAFLANGTTHSRRAETLPYIVRRAQREGISFSLTFSSYKGHSSWHMKRVGGPSEIPF